jgi:hypothetical protein
MTLSGWQRIGVVASGLWLLVGGVWGNNVGLDQGEFALGILDSCTDSADVCMVQFNRIYNAATQDHWLYALCYAVIPLVVSWCLAGLAIVAYRWIYAGFCQE